MCGIVGYVGKKDCTKVLLDSLSKLEYRGYDSAGIAVFENDAIKTKKTKGRLADLEIHTLTEMRIFLSFIMVSLKTTELSRIFC